ncbi:hypothetical protein LOK49_LG06G02842 [Camellia lanceoleosa]|uniref:Uncharacterized protein n=1 Tax=Camellia lanceoleosa TaxID=1840588 RepID=A0ACC0H8S9_9ERIC|nr:hypothetical protein LOK49_LG06G02842 [Camellia lanceoleosa]
MVQNNVDGFRSTFLLLKSALPQLRSRSGGDIGTVLSDVETDDLVPISIKSPQDASVERFREVLEKLDRERQACESVDGVEVGEVSKK